MSKPATHSETFTRLPDEVVAPATPRSVTVSFGLALLVVALANGLAIAALHRTTPNPATHVVKAKWALADEGLGPGYSLILGDSSGNQGLNPEFLNELVGGEWVNLCTFANHLTLGDAWLLEQYIQRHGPPERVLVVHVYDIWARPVYADAFADIPRPFGFWGQMNPPLDLTVKGQVEIAIQRYLPLYFSDRSLKMLLMHPGRVKAVHERINAQGFMAETVSDPAQVQGDYEEQLAKAQAMHTELSEPNREGLSRIAELAATHGFTVDLVYGPMYDALWEEPEVRDYFAEVDQQLHELVDEHDGLRLLHDEPATYPITQLQNCEHLTVDGAADYTKRVAAWILEADDE